MSEVLRQANEVVNVAETRYLLELLKWRNDSEHRAGSCKCLNCVKESESAKEALETERVRLGGVRVY